MVRRTLSLTAVLAVGLLAACGSAGSVTSPTPTAAAATPTPVPTAPPTQAPTQTVAPQSLDPCDLVTATEASSVSGAIDGPGREVTLTGTGRECQYGYQTLNVFNVIVATATDAATAQADWAGEEAKVKSLLEASAGGNHIGVALNDTSDLTGADRAAVGTGTASIGGITYGISAIFFLKGAVFVTFSDFLRGTPPSIATMEGEAGTVLGRLP